MAIFKIKLDGGRIITFNDSTGKFVDSSGGNNELEILEAIWSEVLKPTVSTESFDDLIGEQQLGAVKIGSKWIAFDYCMEDNGPNEYKVFKTQPAAIKYVEDAKEYYDDIISSEKYDQDMYGESVQIVEKIVKKLLSESRRPASKREMAKSIAKVCGCTVQKNGSTYALYDTKDGGWRGAITGTGNVQGIAADEDVLLKAGLNPATLDWLTTA